MASKLTATSRSRSDIADAIRGFSPANWCRLKDAAMFFAHGRPIDPDDLLQEAFRRALEGCRICPNHVDVVRFLVEAMRSIAHGEKEKQDRRPRLVPLASHGDISEGAVDPPAPEPTAEKRLEGDQERAAIIGIFDDDEIAQIIVEGILEEMEGEELRMLTELDATAYESKRKLIRRRIKKYLRRELIP